MKVVIIYNPNSTGDSEKNAKDLAHELRGKKIEVSVRETTHVGHGEEIAASYAKSGKDVVLISSSGDGGYNEVINGALVGPSKNLVVGVLPSGNANDHHTAIGSDSLAKAIVKKDFQHIDTIKVSATVKGEAWVRYAHSYVGLGVTAVTAKSLTDERPNIFTEKWIVARSLLSFRYVKLNENGKIRRYSSILFSNIATMSKVLTLAKNASVVDGKFEMSTVRFRSKLRLIVYLLTAATIGVKRTQSLPSYHVETVSLLSIQLDGEVFMIDKGSQLTVESAKQNLHCVL